MLFAVALLSLTCFVLVDYQMKIVARASFPETAALASFFGRFYSAVGLTQLLFQFLLVSWLLRRLGIITCLMLMPAIHLVMASLFFGTGHGLLASHALLIITAANFLRMTVTETLEMPAREMSLLPLPARLRLRAQAMMGGMLAPLGQGLGGLCIAALLMIQLELYELSLVVAGGAALWLLALSVARPLHRETLARSLRNAQLDPVELQALISRGQVDHALDQLLKNPDPEVVRFTFELLRDRPLGGLSRRVAALAKDERPEVAAAALTALGADGRRSQLPVIDRALDADDDQVRAAAVQAHCALTGREAVESHRGWLDSSDPVIRSAAMIGLGRHGGEAGREAVAPVVLKMARSSVRSEQIEACRVVAELGAAAPAGALRELLEADRDEVRRAAVEAVGHLADVELVPDLIALAEPHTTRREALRALGKMPEAAVEPIAAVIPRVSLDEELRVGLYQVLAEIGGEAAASTLWTHFRQASELTSSVSAGKALHRLALAGPIEHIEQEPWRVMLDLLRGKLELLNRACDEIGADDLEVYELVRDHQWLEVERLFQLLSLRYDARGLARIRYNLDSPQEVLRANALELLDALLPRRLALELVPLIDPLVERLIPPGRGLTEETAAALRTQSAWLRVVTRVSLFSLTPAEDSTEDMSVDMAWAEELALAPIQAQVSELKRVPLFSAVPADDLVHLAGQLRPRRLAAEEVLFEQGVSGESMSLIQQGSVSVRIGDTQVAKLGAGEVIGEMAVIDGQPRSATCVAAEPSELIEISATDFESLVRGHPSTARAVLRTISERLRTRTSLQAPAAPSISSVPDPAPPLVCRNSGAPCSERGELADLIERCSFLQEVELFADLAPEDLAKIAELGEVVSVYPGEALFEKGDHGDSMYLIRSGVISVQIDRHEVARLGARDCIGEMALIDGFPRSATCAVVDDAVLLRIGADDFNLLLDLQPDIAIGLMRTLSARLRKSN